MNNGREKHPPTSIVFLANSLTIGVQLSRFAQQNSGYVNMGREPGTISSLGSFGMAYLRVKCYGCRTNPSTPPHVPPSQLWCAAPVPGKNEIVWTWYLCVKGPWDPESTPLPSKLQIISGWKVPTHFSWIQPCHIGWVLNETPAIMLSWNLRPDLRIPCAQQIWESNTSGFILFEHCHGLEPIWFNGHSTCNIE